ncbi:NUDIX domain-containing protein [Corynebacterium epidermidicanis]|uniref:ADP-ribose pyrophosphatase n=1 Tax=Corynebacterium epidermidicanis TaxID=1050174 RepID=A0A0G3GSB5_9CORY|nr:NUDIX hydrolase [Corynebacterium epidermidicanis]AKK04029.1 ADP-ribose pyrophosphatase [Corynebacterium epidermidicanis]
MFGDGDGWAAGPQGTRMWGLHGAAGLFLVAGDKLLLQHRAHWTANGGTWGLPGGARDSHETAAEAALREAEEETGIKPSQVTVLAELCTSGPFPGDPLRPELAAGWTYTTVLARADKELATTANNESLELRWVDFGALTSMNLIPPLAENLDLLCREIGRRKAC